MRVLLLPFRLGFIQEKDVGTIVEVFFSWDIHKKESKQNNIFSYHCYF